MTAIRGLTGLACAALWLLIPIRWLTGLACACAPKRKRPARAHRCGDPVLANS